MDEDFEDKEFMKVLCMMAGDINKSLTFIT
jgi:hypothetical protein